LTTKLGTCHPNICTAETGSQLLTATSYSRPRSKWAKMYLMGARMSSKKGKHGII
jgi:hypothetical protein